MGLRVGIGNMAARMLNGGSGKGDVCNGGSGRDGKSAPGCEKRTRIP